MGVIITAVDPNSDAAEEGLQRGDLIVSVNRQAVTTPAQVIAGSRGGTRAGRTSVLLLVKRGHSPGSIRRSSTSAAPVRRLADCSVPGACATVAASAKGAAEEERA